MSRREKPIEFRLPAPFEDVEVDLFPVHYHGEAEPRGYSVGVMDRGQGRGMRYSLEYAEAMANGILKAVRAHRRREARKAREVSS